MDGSSRLSLPGRVQRGSSRPLRPSRREEEGRIHQGRWRRRLHCWELYLRFHPGGGTHVSGTVLRVAENTTSLMGLLSLAVLFLFSTGSPSTSPRLLSISSRGGSPTLLLFSRSLTRRTRGEEGFRISGDVEGNDASFCISIQCTDLLFLLSGFDLKDYSTSELATLSYVELGNIIWAIQRGRRSSSSHLPSNSHSLQHPFLPHFPKPPA